MASAAVGSTAVILIMFIYYHCSHYMLELCVGSLFCDVGLSVVSSFAIILPRKRMLVALLVSFIVFLLSCGCQCSVSLPYGTKAWSMIVSCPGKAYLLFWC